MKNNETSKRNELGEGRGDIFADKESCGRGKVSKIYLKSLFFLLKIILPKNIWLNIPHRA